MFRWLADKWHARCRRLDLEILWPELKSQAVDDFGYPDLDTARMAFFAHAMFDPSWRRLGEAKVVKLVTSLK